MKRIRFGVFSFTLLLVFIMGLALMASMDIGSPVTVLASTGRQPASISNETVGLKEGSPIADGSPMTLEIDCSDLSVRPPVTVKSAHLRLKTKGCAAKALVNTTNGFEATLFEVGNKKFSSDYVSLSAGENQLSLVQDKENGLPITIILSVLFQ